MFTSTYIITETRNDFRSCIYLLKDVCSMYRILCCFGRLLCVTYFVHWVDLLTMLGFERMSDSFNALFKEAIRKQQFFHKNKIK
jgi:hypothetical protein